jgi:hypothetical protein
MSGVALLGLCMGLGLPAPARASSAVCTGTWHMDTVFAFDLARPMQHSFEMTPTGGGCAPAHAASASGMLNGVCFGATGGGVLDGHVFDLRWSGGSLVFSGGVVGTLAIAADASTGDACIGGSADDFVLAGTLTLV